jgi:hypothetical protein
MGIFFILVFTVILLIELGSVYGRYLLKTNQSLGQIAAGAEQLMTQGAAYQAGLLDNWVLTPLWFLIATVCGGLIARDTLYRIRPLVYAHPVRHQDYLLAKAGAAMAVPFIVMLPFVFSHWILSLLIAGTSGPVWPTLPLHLVPAAVIISALMGSITLGASAMAGSPRAAFGWVLGIVLGSLAIGGILSGILGSRAFMAVSPAVLATAWPQLLCGVEDPILSLAPALAGTLAHVALWTWIARQRTRPDEAVL